MQQQRVFARARMRTDTRSGRSAPAYVGEALHGAAVGVSTVGALVSPSRVGEAVLTLLRRLLSGLVP